MLLLVSLLLVVVSFVLIWTWGYNYYTRDDVAKPVSPVSVVQPDAATYAVRDSLQQVYDETLRDLDVQLDSTLSRTDSLKSELDIKLAEFFRLRDEIAVLLKNRAPANNFSAARQKINELQVRADDLKAKNDDVEKVNKNLGEVLNQLKNPEKNTDKNVKPPASVKTSGQDNTERLYQLFTASELRLTALKTENGEDEATTDADKVVKFSGTFSVVNFNSQVSNAEIMVVIIKPDGNVLKNSGWESGSFSTPDGKKIYTCKVNFNYAKGEARSLNFTVRSGTLTSGTYNMEIYYNGLLIGRTSRILS